MKKFTGPESIKELINIVKNEFSTVKTDISKLKSDLETKITTTLDNHANNKNNPHGVTTTQIGAAKSSHTHALAQYAQSGGQIPVSGFMSANDKKKLDGIADNANNYTHPTSHPATMITEDTTHRFVSDAEKTAWNGNAAGDHNHDSVYYKKSGGEISGPVTVNGDFRLSNPLGGTRKILGMMSSNDCWMIAAHGNDDSTSERGSGSLEIATGDDANEPIIVSQYGSGGNFDFNNSAPVRSAYLLDNNGNTSFPGNLTSKNIYSGEAKLTGDVTFEQAGGETKGIFGRIADNDAWRVVGGGYADGGWLEIATSDNGTEPIFVRQYDDRGYANENGVSFTHYCREAVLLDANGNTHFPGTLDAAQIISGGYDVATKADIDALKSNFQDGCNKIASAVTAKGVNTPSGSSPDTIAYNISQISSGGSSGKYGNWDAVSELCHYSGFGLNFNGWDSIHALKYNVKYHFDYSLPTNGNTVQYTTYGWFSYRFVEHGYSNSEGRFHWEPYDRYGYEQPSNLADIFYVENFTKGFRNSNTEYGYSFDITFKGKLATGYLQLGLSQLTWIIGGTSKCLGLVFIGIN